MIWSRGLGPGLQQGTPLVYEGVMYMPNPRDVIQALDAVTGDVRWEAGCGPATAAMFLTTVQRATRDSGTGPPTGPFAKLPKASAASSSDARGLRGQDRGLTAEERANVLATCLHPRRTGRGLPTRRYD